MSQKTNASIPGSLGRVLRTSAIGLGFAVVVIVLLLWLAGTFHAKIDERREGPGAVAGRPMPADTSLADVSVVRLPRIESAVGTIEAVHKAAVASKLLAKVVEVNVQAGQRVTRDEVLVRLDDEDLNASLRQAEAGVQAAQANRDYAHVEFDRIKGLYEDGIEAKTAFERAETALKTAEAELDRARQARALAETLLAYATITSPIDGIVIDKRVEVGDTATPGQVLLTLYDPTRMQLVASVRESLTQRLEVGQAIGVAVETLGKTCEGRISEIVPEAESSSRTFSVKVTGPCPPGIYSGMFGRLLIPLDEREVLTIPQAAVRRVGQLDLVDVAEKADGGRQLLRRRVVQLGERIDDKVEVLSGLRAGEQVALPAGA